MRREPQERVRVDVRPGPAGHVVHDDRQIALVGDGAVVGLEHPAVRAVVVRRDDERRIRAELGRATGRADRGGRVVGPGPRDDPDPAARGPLGGDLDGGRDEALALPLGERRGFAGRPARDEAIDPGKDLPADEPPERRLVEGPVSRERRDERGEGAAESKRGGARTWGAVGSGHRDLPSGRGRGEGVASDQLVDDGIEGMEARGVDRAA